jgi:hypothetical protein
MEIAKLMVAGSDLWLNTPLPPLEASGTSGIKAAPQRRPQPEHPRWLVDRSLHRGGDRLVDQARRQLASKPMFRPYTKNWRRLSSRSTTSSRSAGGGCHRAHRLLFQQSTHDATLRDRGVLVLMPGNRIVWMELDYAPAKPGAVTR